MSQAACARRRTSAEGAGEPDVAFDVFELRHPAARQADGERERVGEQLFVGAAPASWSWPKTFMAITPIPLRTATGRASSSKPPRAIGVAFIPPGAVGHPGQRGVQGHLGAVEVVPLQGGLSAAGSAWQVMPMARAIFWSRAS